MDKFVSIREYHGFTPLSNPTMTQFTQHTETKH